MQSKRIVARIASITILTTSLFGLSLSDSQAYSYNQYGTVSRTGNTITRSYGTPSTNNSAKTTSLYKNTTTPRNTNTQNRTYTNNYNSTSNQNTSYRSTSGTITRYYGTGSSNSSRNLASNESINNVSSNNESMSNKTETKQTSNSSNISSSVDRMLDLINKERSSNGLNTLSLDTNLTSVAQLKSDDMVRSNYFSHTSPHYGTIHDMIKNAGINYYIAGENIAKAYSVESAHKNFMNSGLHRRAILTAKFNHVGIGITKNSSGMNVISVMFIERK